MNSKDLELDIPAGAPAVAIPREFHMLVAKILNFFKVRGWGRLTIDGGYNWTIIIDPVATGQSRLFKVPVLLGAKRSSPTARWESMGIDEAISENPTGTIYDVGPDATKALRLRWDYVRAVDSE
jgi:hypothetical protein